MCCKISAQEGVGRICYLLTAWTIWKVSKARSIFVLNRTGTGREWCNFCIILCWLNILRYCSRYSCVWRCPLTNTTGTGYLKQKKFLLKCHTIIFSKYQLSYKKELDFMINVQTRKFFVFLKYFDVEFLKYSTYKNMPSKPSMQKLRTFR